MKGHSASDFADVVPEMPPLGNRSNLIQFFLFVFHLLLLIVEINNIVTPAPQSPSSSGLNASTSPLPPD